MENPFLEWGNPCMTSYSLRKTMIKERDLFLEGISWKCYERTPRTSNRVISGAMDKSQSPNIFLGSESFQKQMILINSWVWGLSRFPVSGENLMAFESGLTLGWEHSVPPLLASHGNEGLPWTVLLLQCPIHVALYHWCWGMAGVNPRLLAVGKISDFPQRMMKERPFPSHLFQYKHFQQLHLHAPFLINNSNTIIPLYLWGIHFKTLSRCLKPWIVPNPMYTMHFLYTHTYGKV